MRSSAVEFWHLGVDVINGSAHIIGGRSGGILYNTSRHDVLLLSGDEWDRIDGMSASRSSIAAIAYNDLLYVFGGEATTTTFATVEVYSPAKKTWEIVGEMPTARHGFGAVEVDGKIFIIGGSPRPGLSVTDLNEVFIP